MGAAPKTVIEYIVVGLSLDNLRQMPLKKFESKAAAEEFMRSFSPAAFPWMNIDKQSLVIIEKERHAPIPTLENIVAETDSFSIIYREKVLKRGGKK